MKAQGGINWVLLAILFSILVGIVLAVLVVAPLVAVNMI